MKVNMGSADRIIRMIVAVVFAIMYFTGIVPGTLGLILTIVALIFLFTATTGFCPIYRVLGVSTKKDIK